VVGSSPPVCKVSPEPPSARTLLYTVVGSSPPVCKVSPITGTTSARTLLCTVVGSSQPSGLAWRSPDPSQTVRSTHSSSQLPSALLFPLNPPTWSHRPGSHRPTFRRRSSIQKLPGQKCDLLVTSLDGSKLCPMCHESPPVHNLAAFNLAVTARPTTPNYALVWTPLCSHGSAPSKRSPR
jgi:hypothetical protein